MRDRSLHCDLRAPALAGASFFVALCAAAMGVRAQIASEHLTLPPAAVLRPWVDAVLRHRPNEMDSPAFVPSAWTREELRHAWVYMQLLTFALRDRPLGDARVVLGGVSTRIGISRTDLASVRDVAISVRQVTQTDDFLKRAAVLHTDTLRFISEHGGDPASDVSMLMPRRLMIQTEDGRQQSFRTGAVHWEFARVLLDQVQDAGDVFVRDWYRATLALKLSLNELDTAHFEHALGLFPEDAEIRFLVGCLHEAFADPRVQAARVAAQLPPRLRLAFEPSDSELARASELFQRALDIDPAHSEARLRLGATLHRRGKFKEAVEHLGRALQGTSEPVLEYYGYLFLSAAHESLGRMGDARHALERALPLFPAAQAPRLALSQLAHRLGDRVGAERALREVMMPAESRSRQADPWWIYHMAAGRHASEALDAVQSRVVRSQ